MVEAPFGEPVTIQTPTGVCSLFNTHLISQKLIGVIGAMLNLEEWDGVSGPHVMSIVFRADDSPVDNSMGQIFAVSHADVQAFAINLSRNFQEALEVAITVEPSISIRATLWNELLRLESQRLARYGWQTHLIVISYAPGR